MSWLKSLAYLLERAQGYTETLKVGIGWILQACI